MSVIVTDAGFGPEDWMHGFDAPDTIGANDRGQALAIDLNPDDDPAVLSDVLEHVAMVRVIFPGFADGRGFGIARRVRQMGYTGRLRAAGHVIADQYAMARRCGFDEVEISDALAARQPEAQWRARADWRARDYQSRLRG